MKKSTVKAAPAAQQTGVQIADKYRARCPWCLRSYYAMYHALSRLDNHTHICGDCGLREAWLVATARRYRPKDNAY